MKTEVLIVVLVVVALAAVFIIFSKPAYPLSEEDAKKFFLEDLAEKYPSADVREITEITPVTREGGSTYYSLKARVTNGLASPCPERIHVYYDYPPKNFVSQPPEYITRGCLVCLNEPVCTLLFPEEAIIASHTYEGAEEVASFVRQQSDAKAESVEFRPTYKNYTDVWVVGWGSPTNREFIYRVVLSKTQNRVLEANKIAVEI